MPDLEAALDVRLVDRRAAPNFAPEWLEDGMKWSAAVWTAAEPQISPLPDGEMSEAATAFAARAAFICGAHRSGTTLLRDLLDGHPALCILPAEANYFGGMERTFARLLPDQRLAAIGQAWLRRLANPINQPPFWLLGRSGKARSPYVEFARHYVACAGLLREARAPVPDLTAIACAYAIVRGQNLGQTAWWIEKTPGTERHLARIRRTFPQARIIHIVRDPDAAARSYLALVQRTKADTEPVAVMLRELGRSYRIARREIGSAGPDRYFVMRYDELVENRAAAMRRLAAFLDIAQHPALSVQSIAGLPASANTSHAGAEVLLRQWSPLERFWLARARAQYGKLARAFR